MSLSPDIKHFVKEHEKEDVFALSLQTKLYPHIDMSLAIRQIAGRQVAKEKMPTWYSNDSIVYPPHISLEQCSSEHTAIYKATLCKGESFVDLTGGLGVDFSVLSSNFSQSVYVEKQTELSELAKLNFAALGLKNATVVNADAVEYLSDMTKVDCIYIDPARRSTSGRKTVLIEDCTPNLLEIEDLLEQNATMVIIKLSPMLDIALALQSLSHISDVHIISYENECKELVFVKKIFSGCTLYHCVNILKNRTDVFTFDKRAESELSINFVSTVCKYLYEPNASILKGGAYRSVAKQFELKKLHPNSHLYTSDFLLSDFQGRKFVVEDVVLFNKKDLKRGLSDIKQANITTRNFPLSVQELRKKTALKEGGDTYIFATTLADEQKVLVVCKKAE